VVNAIKNLLVPLTKKGNGKVKTSDGNVLLESMAKTLQKESAIRRAKYAEEAKATREATKQKKELESSKSYLPQRNKEQAQIALFIELIATLN
jgi:hypothetical protein